jgi:serine/threonine-protein kinase
MPVESAVFIATKICQGLAYAHELTTVDNKQLRIVHRDITPANVLITKYGEVKIVDFGLAKASSQLAESDAGMIKGKYGYLAPETVMELPVDHRVDIFSMGIILWEMLAGQRLFFGRTEYETVKLVHAAVIPSLSAYNPMVPRELEWIVLRALSRDPKTRYQSAGHFGRDLTTFLYRYGRAVSEYEIADLVRTTMGIQSQGNVDDGLQKISQYLDMMLLEFKSLTSDPEEAPLSVAQPESADWRSRSDERPLGGLAEALEGPEPEMEMMEVEPDPPEQQQQQQQPSAGVAGWFRGLIR